MYNGPTKAFFRDLFTGEHDFLEDEFFLALYTDRDVMSPDLEAYTTTGEMVGTNYPAGGLQIFVRDGYPKEEGIYPVAVRFDSVIFPNITGQVGAALIYNGNNNRAVRCFDFGIVENVVTSDINVNFDVDPTPELFIILPNLAT